MLKDHMKFGKTSLPPDFLNIWALLSWEQLTIWVRFFCKKWSHLDILSIGIISFENCQPSIFTDGR